VPPSTGRQTSWPSGQGHHIGTRSRHRAAKSVNHPSNLARPSLRCRGWGSAGRGPLCLSVHRRVAFRSAGNGVEEGGASTEAKEHVPETRRRLPLRPTAPRPAPVSPHWGARPGEQPEREGVVTPVGAATKFPPTTTGFCAGGFGGETSPFMPLGCGISTVSPPIVNTSPLLLSLALVMPKPLPFIYCDSGR